MILSILAWLLSTGCVEGDQDVEDSMAVVLQATTATSGDAAWVAVAPAAFVHSVGAINNTVTNTDETAFASPYTIPIGDLAVDTIVRYVAQVIFVTDGAGGQFVTCRVRLGGAAGTLLVSAPVLTQGGIAELSGWFRVTTAGAGGVASGFGQAVAVSANTTVDTGTQQQYANRLFAVDTTATQTLVVTYDFNASNAGNVATLDAFAVWTEAP